MGDCPFSERRGRRWFVLVDEIGKGVKPAPGWCRSGGRTAHSLSKVRTRRSAHISFWVGSGRRTRRGRRTERDGCASTCRRWATRMVLGKECLRSPARGPPVSPRAGWAQARPDEGDGLNARFANAFEAMACRGFSAMSKNVGSEHHTINPEKSAWMDRGRWTERLPALSEAPGDRAWGHDQVSSSHILMKRG
jgi:hypothetical protein